MKAFHRILLLLVAVCSSTLSFAQTDTAHFDITSQSGSCTYKLFHLRSTSTPGYTSLKWYLGNGSVITTTADSVTALYTTAGTYHVTLTAFYGSDSATYSMDLIMPNNVNVAFAADDSVICPGTTVHFSNTSTTVYSTPITYLWLINGSTYTSTTPSYTFTGVGYYDVKLTATNADGCSNDLLKHNYIQVTARPAMSYTLSKPNICRQPFTETFTSSATGTAPLTYKWRSAHAGTIGTVNPLNYTYSPLWLSDSVWLIVVDGNGCKDSISKIVRNDTIHASFTVDSPACALSPLTFHSTSVVPGGAYTRFWDYGDGTPSATATGNTTHTYITAGPQTVTFIAFDANCADTVTRTIMVRAKPDADFAVPLSCNDTTAVSFIPDTSYASVRWQIDNHSPIVSATLDSPIHYGISSISMSVTDVFGCKDTVVKADTVYDMYPVVFGNTFTTDYLGCGPDVHFNARVYTLLFGFFPYLAAYPSPVVYYQWDFGDGSPIVSGATDSVPVHIYSDHFAHYPQCTMTLANGCIVVARGLVKVHEAPVGSYTMTSSGPCRNDPVTFNITLSSGTVNDITFLMGDGSPDYDLGYSIPGYPSTYTFQYTFANSGYFTPTMYLTSGTCLATYTATTPVTIVSPIAAGVMNFNCSNPLELTLDAVTAGVDSLRWRLSDGSTTVTAHTVHTFAAAGPVNAELYVYNNTTGCMDSLLLHATLYNLHPDLIIPDSQLCAGVTNIETFAVTPSIPLHYTQYSWYVDTEYRGTTLEVPDGFGGGIGSAIIDTFINEGTHRILVVALDDHGCHDSTIRYVYVASPHAGFIMSPRICAGDTAALHDTSTDISSRTMTRRWAAGSDTLGGDTSIHYVFNLTSTYDTGFVTLTVTDNEGCKDSITRNIYIYKPLAKFTPRTIFACVGVADVFTGGSTSQNPIRYNWTFGDGGTSTIKSPSHIFTSSGDFTVTLTITDTVVGCTDDTSIVIHVSAVTAAITMSDTLTKCRPHIVNISGIGTNSDTGWINYTWRIQGSLQNGQYHAETYLMPGNDTIVLIDSNIHGCRDTAYATMTVLGFAGDFYTSTHLGCSPLIVTVGVVHSTDTATWILNGHTYIGADTVTTAFTTPGLYTAILIRADTACQSVSVDTIRVDTLMPVINAAHISMCLGQADTFMNGSTCLYSTVATTHWDFGDGITGSTSTCVHTYNTPGTYVVTLTATSVLGCSSTTTLTVTVNAPPSIDLAGHTVPVCNGSTVTLYDSVSGGAPSYTYAWSGPAGYTSAVQNPVRTPFASGMAGTYTLIVTDAGGCKDTAVVVMPLSPLPPVLSGPTVVCPSSTITITATIAGGTWSASNGNASVASSDTLRGIVTGITAGTVIISYVASTACGSSAATLTVTVITPPTISPSPTSVCVGSNRTLTVSPTGSTYIWSSLSTGIATVSTTGQIGGVTSGTAYIRCTNNITGCYSTDTITVNPLPGPITRVGGGSLTVCTGDSIRVHNDSTGGHWTRSGTSFTLFPTTPTTDTGLRGGTTASSTGTIIYTLAPTGCARSAIVTVGTNPTVTITPAVQLYCSSPVSLTAKGSGGRRFNSIPNYTYTWTSDPTIIIPITVDSIVYVSGLTATQTYTVTVSDSNGCRAKTTATVTPVCSDLCSGSTVSLLGVGGSIASGTYGPGTFYIDNLSGSSSTITIGASVTFDNAVVAIAPGKLLQVNAGSSLTITGSHLYSCRTDTMWQGIKVVAGGSITLMRNSLIEDAITAVWMSNPSSTATAPVLYCNSVTFNRNYVGVQITTYSGTDTLYPFNFFNTVFTSRDMTDYTDGFLTYPFAWPAAYEFKLPYATTSVVEPPYNIVSLTGKPTSSGGAPYTPKPCKQISTGDAFAGLSLINVGTTVAPVYPGLLVAGNFANIENPFLFDNMTYGVYDTNSQFTITGGIFMNCHPNSVSHGGGAGIKAINAPGGRMLQLSVNRTWASDTVNYNAFYDCKYGVSCENIRFVYGKYNRMYSTHMGDTTGRWGYKILYMSGTSLATPATLELNGNYFGNIDTGIHYLVHDGLYGNMNMCRNQFIAQPTNWSAGYTNMAIFGSSTALGGSSVGTLHTDSNEVYLAANGIYLNGFKQRKAYTNSNNIWLKSASGNGSSYGIRHTGCKSNVIQRNYVKSDDLKLTGTAIGISGESNLTAIVSCDSVEYLKKGFSFYGLGNTTTWRNNTMGNCVFGFYIDLGYIGTGVDTVHAFDNKWVGTWSSSSSFHTYNNGASNANLSKMFVRVNSGGLVYDPYYNGGAGGTSPLVFGFPTTCSSASCFSPTLGGIAHAPDSVTNNCVPTGVDFPIDLDYMPAVTDTSGNGEGEGKQRGIGNSAHVPERIKWVAQMHVWNAVLAYPEMADSSVVLNKFREEALNSRYSWLTNIAASLDTNDILTAQALVNEDMDAHVNTNTDAATGVIMSDAPEADYVVGNYLSYYDQYIKYLNNTMNGEDTAIVFALAGLCPFTDGEIVYSARTLAAVLGGNVATNDEGCAILGANKHSPTVYSNSYNEQRYKLYPNPNNGTITVSQIIADERETRVEVVDAMGKTIYSCTLSFAYQNSRIQLPNSAPGLYLLKLTNADGKVFSYKFVVQ